MAGFNKQRTLKILTILILFYAITQLLLLVIPFVRSYFSLGDNPLLPDYLIQYIAFPLYFLIPIFLLIIGFTLRSLHRNDYSQGIVIVLMGFIILYFIFGYNIYGFLQNYNPYGT